MKLCAKCKQVLPLSNFGTYKGKNRKPGALRAECKKCNAKRHNLYYHSNEKYRLNASESTKKSYQKLRDNTLNYYGAKCNCCGETNKFFLTFHHINGGGSRHRKEIGSGGRTLVQWIVNNNYPNTIEILCFNCNCADGFYGECPHKESQDVNRNVLQQILYNLEFA